MEKKEWRRMKEKDIERVNEVENVVNIDFLEDEEVLRERLKIYKEG